MQFFAHQHTQILRDIYSHSYTHPHTKHPQNYPTLLTTFSFLMSSKTVPWIEVLIFVQYTPRLLGPDGIAFFFTNPIGSGGGNSPPGRGGAIGIPGRGGAVGIPGKGGAIGTPGSGGAIGIPGRGGGVGTLPVIMGIPGRGGGGGISPAAGMPGNGGGGGGAAAAAPPLITATASVDAGGGAAPGVLVPSADLVSPLLLAFDKPWSAAALAASLTRKKKSWK